MSNGAAHLRLVSAHAAEERPLHLEDIGLTALILVVAALPIALAAAGLGRWEDTSVGFGTVGVVFSGRELLGELLLQARAGRTT